MSLFILNHLKTYVIENNKVVKLKGKSAYSIDFPSNDEKIVNMYKNRFSKNFEIDI